MIQKLEIISRHAEVSPATKKYVLQKIGRLDKYIARTARESVHAEVRLEEPSKKGKKQFKCSVTMHLPHETLEISETAINMYAAIDIVEAHLKQQLQRYKQTHTDGKLRRRLFARMRTRGQV